MFWVSLPVTLLVFEASELSLVTPLGDEVSIRDSTRYALATREQRYLCIGYLPCRRTLNSLDLTSNLPYGTDDHLERTMQSNL